MDGYELDPAPFYFNPHTSVSLFKGRSLRRNRLPVVLKRHDFVLIQEKSQQVQMVQTLNAALIQAKVQHPHSCDILEIQMEIDKANCAIFHVLEALDSDLQQDIEMRRKNCRPYEETELRQMLEQTASALASAHSKNIAHRDVKPSNIFRCANNYKLGDFGCYFVKRDTSMTQSTAGDVRYMSPQLREACIRRTQYNAFKADVFALGASLLHMATLNSPESLLTSDRLDEAVSRQVQTLTCSPQLQQLLCRMLAVKEDARLNMQDLCATFQLPLLQGLKLDTAPSTSSGVVTILSQDSRVALSALTKRTKHVSISPDTHVPLREEAKSAPSLKDTRAEEGSKELVRVTSTFLTSFYFRTSIWGSNVRLRTEIQVDGMSRWVMLDGRVFCCGGEGGGRLKGLVAAYMLGRDGAMERKANMSEARMNHGLLAIQNAAYVFGGFINTALKTCEKWGEDNWSHLPSMREGRSYFNPCMLERKVYLCGEGSYGVEVFVPQTDTFLPLLIPLPEATPCCLYVDNHLLVVHSTTYILKFAVEPDGHLAVRSQVRSPEIYKRQNSQPVVNKAQGLFYMIYDGKCICLEMETGAEGPAVG